MAKQQCKICKEEKEIRYMNLCNGCYNQRMNEIKRKKFGYNNE